MEAFFAAQKTRWEYKEYIVEVWFLFSFSVYTLSKVSKSNSHNARLNHKMEFVSGCAR